MSEEEISKNELIANLEEELAQAEAELLHHRHQRNLIKHSRILKIAAAIYNAKKYLFYKLTGKNKISQRFNELQEYITLRDIAPEKPWIHPEKKTTVGVHLHVYFIDLFEEIMRYVQNIPFNFSCYITTDSKHKAALINLHLNKLYPDLRVEIIIVPNVGWDVAPWIIEMSRFNNKCDYWCHIHTKKSRHVPQVGKDWRNYLLENLLGGETYIANIIATFEKNKQLGLIFPPFYSHVYNYKNCRWSENYQLVQEYFKKWHLQPPPKQPDFCAGTMLWYRAEALEPLFKIGFTYDDFVDEKNQFNNTLAHLLERSLVYFAETVSYSHLKVVSEQELTIKTNPFLKENIVSCNKTDI